MPFSVTNDGILLKNKDARKVVPTWTILTSLVDVSRDFKKKRFAAKCFSLQDSLLNVSLYFLLLPSVFLLLKNCVQAEKVALKIMPTTCYSETHYQINSLVTINSSDSNSTQRTTAS